MPRFVVDSFPDNSKDIEEWKISLMSEARKYKLSSSRRRESTNNKELTITIYSPKLSAPIEEYQSFFHRMVYARRLARPGEITASSILWVKSKRKRVEIVVEPVDS